MRMRRAVPLATAFLMVAGLAIGCGRSSLRIGWRETSGLRHKSAHYRSFDGLERASFRADGGETLVVDYSVEVQDGALAMSLVDAEGEQLWDETFREDAADVLRMTAPSDGRYEVRIRGVSTRGAFDVSWRVEES